MPVPPGNFNPHGSVTGNATSGRGNPARKAALIAGGGGTAGSERAVALALKWLASHQMADGGWNFDHRQGQCQGRCKDHGAASQARNGATAMALLPFLGAGHTHMKSRKYKNVVRGGLAYLGKAIKDNGSLHESGGRSVRGTATSSSIVRVLGSPLTSSTLIADCTRQAVVH